MADDQNQQELISRFAEMTQSTVEQAARYLEANSWDIMAATNSYFQDLDEGEAGASAPTAQPQADANYTGPRTLDGRPAPQGASGSQSGARKTASQPKRKGVATLGSLGGGAPQDDSGDSDGDFDDDEDERDRGNLFAGGEKSGLAVQDPKQDGGSKKLIGDILAKAKANSSRPEAEDSDAEPAAPSRFRGTGMTLGGEGTESRSIPDPLGPQSAANAEPQERILHIWEDGFSIDDGELHRFDDPANMADLNLIRQGRAPLHLMNVSHDAPVDVKLQQHKEKYVPQPKKYKPFGGEGRRLGSPVPGAGGASSATTTSAPSQAASSNLAPTVDETQPTLTLRIQLPDGTRLPARFNTTSTIGDVYDFVNSSNPSVRSSDWMLSTTFPNKEHSDRSLVLGEMAEFKKGGTAVVKRC